MKTTGRIMALDYGSKRIGVALSDELRIVAKPFGIINNTSNRQVYSALKLITGEQEVNHVLVGLPTGGSGEFGSQALAVLKWSRKLAPILGVPLIFWDESYSSSEAAKLRRSRAGKLIVKIDDIAAATILQDYLTALIASDSEPGRSLESCAGYQ